MNSASERRRYYRKKAARQRLRLSFEDKPGYPKTEILATLLDISDGGCRIGTIGPLSVGSLVYVDKQAVMGGPKSEVWAARITWCTLEEDGSYGAGMKFEAPSRIPGAGEKRDAAPAKEIPDYYEILQINSKADTETVHRVYRMMAQRFHPDNCDTGNEEMFRRLLEAYHVLADPEQRAAYDVKHQVQNSKRWKIFDQTSATRGQAAERAKRAGILLVLYTRRLNEPAQPAMTVHEMEDLLGCPREHLEFSLWYLREKGYLTRTDNNRFAITVNGVEAAEAAEIPWAPRERMLAAAIPIA